MHRRTFLKTMIAAGTAAFGRLFLPFAEAKDIQPFSFAHITDIHLDVKGASNWQHREKSVPLFIDTLRQLGRLQQLRFVIFGGDQIHAGPNDRDSLFVFQEWTKQLAVPYYILLGNAEVSPVAGKSKLARQDYLLAWQGRGIGHVGSSWAFDPVPGVRIIGFDVTVDGKPYGEASPPGLAWLERELYASRNRKLVIIATHQLLVPTTSRDAAPEWSIWMVRNHAAVRDLIEHYPNVRLVLSGHHHASKVETLGRITYVADPAIVTYPCAFRLYTVGPSGIYLRNIGLDEKAIVARARELLVADPYARLYDHENPQNVIAYSIGLTEQDRETVISIAE